MLAAACFGVGAASGGCNALSGVDDFNVGSSGGDATAGDDGGSADVANEPKIGNDALLDRNEPMDAGGDTATDARGGGADSPVDGVADVVADVAMDAPTDSQQDAPYDAAFDAGPPSDAGGGDAADGCAVGSPVCEAGCPTMHSDGLGHAFYDCAALDTATLAEALAACAAYSGGQPDACANDPITCSAGDQVCSSGNSAPCACWRYVGPNAGKVGLSSSSTCVCPGSSGSTVFLWH